VGGFGIFGRTYGEISQDMADFLSFAQNEPDVGEWRGGWRYGPNYEQSDMSVTQWPVIGLEAAEFNFGTVVPPYVSSDFEALVFPMISASSITMKGVSAFIIKGYSL